MTINILFPVLNEHLRLEKGIDKCMAFMKENVKIPYKLTIVDNGSDDDTPDIGRMLEQRYEEVEYVRIEERGVGIAFKTGVLRTTADIVGYMDIDLSTDLSYLNKTIELFESLQVKNLWRNIGLTMSICFLFVFRADRDSCRKVSACHIV